MIGELNRRFKWDQDKATPTDKIIRSFHSLTVHAEWTRQLNPEARKLCIPSVIFMEKTRTGCWQS
ncbi:Hypothetical protein FKW44_001379 [Caligus rogercresseyi]|uniref:Uncharacterized protein n=1 Tax=Caligus rogercresseyi TaxID=217165 RepID=A0A7T8KIN6_CALRO|nr:Hypothetical protein FKW44_001379 [Caligus rogercresseyi]